VTRRTSPAMPSVGAHGVPGDGDRARVAQHLATRRADHPLGLRDIELRKARRSAAVEHFSSGTFITAIVAKRQNQSIIRGLTRWLFK